MQIGDKFNQLTIIQTSTRRAANGGKYWICQCDCGNVVEVRGDHLKSGHTKSCGCKVLERINNIMGQRFNRLTVIDITNKRRAGGDVIWKCQCDCGNITFAAASDLRNNRIGSCGCLRSIGEQTVNKLLLANHIDFKKEYTFDDLKDKGMLRFDFAIFRKEHLAYLIEYDGIIHSFKQGAWNGQLDYDLLHKHDLMKNEYCIKNNIPLIRIPYSHLKDLKIEDLILETSPFLFQKL